MENAIYSTKGTWGVIISREQHALIGGPPRFIEALKANLPGVVGQMDRLESQIDWTPGASHACIRHRQS